MAICIYIYIYIYIEPEMADLLDIVIPLIKAEWEDVAYSLQYGIHTVDAIGEKHKNDPHKCCRELLKDWLKSDHGVSPKNWYMLLTIIGKKSNLTAVKEEIIKELENRV